MHRRKIELQIRAVLVTYRIEVRRRDAPTMEEFRGKARAVLDQLDEAVRTYPDLAEQLRDARYEIEADPSQPAGGGGLSPGHPEGRPRSLDG